MCPRADVGSARPHGDVASDPPLKAWACQGKNSLKVPDQPAVGVYQLASTPTVDAVPYEGPPCPCADVGSARPHGDVASDPP